MNYKTFLILGDNNFWYATIHGSITDAKKRLEEIIIGIDMPECNTIPNVFYIYETNRSWEF